MKNQTKEIAIKKEISPLIEKAQNLKITGPKQITQATEFLSQANTYLDKLTEEKEKLTKPINEALKEIRARYKPTELVLQEAISTLRSSISKYQTEQLKLKQKEEEKIAARIGEGKGKIKLETAVEKMSSISTPAQNIQTDTGSIRFRTDKVLKITDPNKIPREYLILDESAILKALKLGAIIPGAEIELIQTPINSR